MNLRVALFILIVFVLGVIGYFFYFNPLPSLKKDGFKFQVEFSKKDANWMANPEDFLDHGYMSVKSGMLKNGNFNFQFDYTKKTPWEGDSSKTIDTNYHGDISLEKKNDQVVKK